MPTIYGPDGRAHWLTHRTKSIVIRERPSYAPLVYVGLFVLAIGILALMLVPSR